jgi:[ribosomal protein S5]-alanine N-acetyltransferase
MKIETKRLILRSPKLSDWKDILEGAKDLSVTSMLAIVPYPYHKKDSKWYVNKSINQWKDKKRKDYTFFIELKSERKVIGVTSIHNVDQFNKKANTGSWINKKYWRKGYILEAKIPILDFAFNNLKLRKIETSAFYENEASNAMSKKLGFKFEGKKRKTVVCKATEKIHDQNEYGLLKEDWKKNRLKLIKELNKNLK